MSERDYTPFDRALMNLDQTFRTLFGRPAVTERGRPGQGQEDVDLTEQERRHIGRLMRVNHTGEVCAQALYQGQALTARNPQVRERLERSAREENDHLAWCEERIDELGGRKSFLNPLWYAGSFAMGSAAGLAGDQWSLGFVVETERQVEDHLDNHIAQVPADDHRTRAILEQMKLDEVHHADVASAAGGVELPEPVKLAMRAVSKVMTGGAYWV
ncbi:2-polyprenyl-3-methyl-6-methoxy-1,4-benzoquinone monooxygenase [Halochromatium glycolicum]|jgi:ubiquinone biosynthesis monooxygenase Coq7|uniref:3-demethoxyubiquinol 3-hydroxylase n=1 Tax=Halochromatium glycolicum TaxID=85075 RepID=A0AAJ0U4V8_9GAMM|nr:2-polyprenyl-3-methyl-6-methoxy-1,4-benzoquinone monooxygenase [Halochromatium glycolicum]MBK1704875.1 demethoxyubiquinone hydroxylase family protein [Halochromatium glycolicum]